MWPWLGDSLDFQIKVRSRSCVWKLIPDRNKVQRNYEVASKAINRRAASTEECKFGYDANGADLVTDSDPINPRVNFTLQYQYMIY
jgi:hypothetical protein